MRIRLLGVVIVLVSLFVLMVGCGGGGGSSSGPSTRSGSITGTITDGLSATRAVRSGAVTVTVDGTSISGTVNADGTFKLDNVPAGLFTLVAKTQGKAHAVVVTVEGGKETNVGEIVLTDAGQISGLVRSAKTNQPVDEAKVTVTEKVLTVTDQMPHPVRATKTNSEGSYTVSGLPVGEYMVSVMKNGCETASLDLNVAAGSTTAGDVKLAEAAAPTGSGSLQGTVSLDDGNGVTKPIAGVLVRVSPKEDPAAMRPLPDKAFDADGKSVPTYGDDGPPGSPFSREYYAYTGEDGTYKIDGVPAGSYLAVAVRPGLELDKGDVTITANQTATKDFVLKLTQIKFGTIRGIVTGSDTKAPIAGAEVHAVIDTPAAGVRSAGAEPSNGGVVTPGGKECVMFARTGDDGSYELLVPTVVTGIKVSKSGYEPQKASATISEGAITTLDVELKKSAVEVKATLSGRTLMVSSSGQQVACAGAEVQACTIVPPGSMMPVSVVSAKSDASGNYEMSLNPGKYEVRAVRDALVSETFTIDVSGTVKKDLVLKASSEPKVTLSGKVFIVDAGGANVPVAGATVAAIPPVATTYSSTDTVKAVSNDSGQYVLSLAPGSYEVMAYKDELKSSAVGIQIKANATRDFTIVKDDSNPPPPPPMK